jgi:hypothetical protein
MMNKPERIERALWALDHTEEALLLEDQNQLARDLCAYMDYLEFLCPFPKPVCRREAASAQRLLDRIDLYHRFS